MELSSYIGEIIRYIDLKSLDGEALTEELINSVLRLKQEQDAWSDEKRARIKKNAEKFDDDKIHDEDMEKFRLELAKTIWHLIVLSEKHKAKITGVMWDDLYRMRVKATPTNKDDFSNLVVKKMADKLSYQLRAWNSNSFDYLYTLKYEFQFLGELQPEIAADYLIYIRDNTVVPEPLDHSHIVTLLEEFAHWSQYNVGDSWATSLRKSPGLQNLSEILVAE
jgi:hypothetical protein